LLLDTHAWIWTQEAPGELGPTATEALLDDGNELWVSTVSTLEIARLIDGDLLALRGPLKGWVARSLESLRCGTAPMTHEIAAAAYSLPGSFHKDPADRILASTARLMDMTLVTADERLLSYPHVRTLDARR
jgi:PIN domain nuclease of toxin-antitoxin system